MVRIMLVQCIPFKIVRMEREREGERERERERERNVLYLKVVLSAQSPIQFSDCPT